jgi:hypothetical protein
MQEEWHHMVQGTEASHKMETLNSEILKVRDDGILVIIVSGHYPSSYFYLKRTTFRRLDSVSVFRWVLLS